MSALTASRPPVPPSIPIPIPIADAASASHEPSLLDTVAPAHAPSPLPPSRDDPPAASPESCSSSLPSLTHSSPCSSSSSLFGTPERANEHLAVLLPKHLWKPDSLASQCDNFYCSVRFSIFERKHHCRKCGGVFCSACSSRTTSLLDTSNLAFLHPPRNVPISEFESPTSLISSARVCNDCWDQIHGTPTTPRTPDLVRPSLASIFSSPISMLKAPVSSSPSPTGGSSPVPSIAALPCPLVPSNSGSLLAVAAPLTRKSRSRSLRTAPSISSLNSNRRIMLRTANLTLPPGLDRSYGELDAYPLRRSSIVCKATGGGRWEPKPDPVLVGYRVPVPGGKAPYEIEMERREKAERERRANPVIKDGAFQYRFPREPEPIVVARSPFEFSTY